MDNPIHELIVLALIFLGIFILFIVISRIIVVRLKKIVKKTDSLIDDYIVKLFTSPVLLILFFYFADELCAFIYFKASQIGFSENLIQHIADSFYRLVAYSSNESSFQVFSE
jgi:hypothetical protein